MDCRVFIELVAAPPGGEGKSNIASCDISDISYDGLKIGVENELTVGSILSLCVEIPAVEDPFYLVGEVKWCRPQHTAEGGWLAGFQMLNSSDSDIDAWRDLLAHV